MGFALAGVPHKPAGVRAAMDYFTEQAKHEASSRAGGDPRKAWYVSARLRGHDLARVDLSKKATTAMKDTAEATKSSTR